MWFQRSLIKVGDRQLWKLLLSICSRSSSCMKSFGLGTRLSYYVRLWGLVSHSSWSNLLPAANSSLSWKRSFVCCCCCLFLFLEVMHYPLVQLILLNPDKNGLQYQIWNLFIYLSIWPWEIYLHLLSYSFVICLVKMPTIFLWTCSEE